MGLIVQRLARVLIAAAAATRLAALVAVGLLTGQPASALDPKRTIMQFHHTTWDARDGVPGGVQGITQTPDGFLWIGTNTGLYRFDGIRAEPFGAELLPGGAITALAVTANGDLWAASSSTHVARVRRGRMTVFEVPTPGLKSAAQFLAPDPDGTLWVATRDTVLNFDGQSWRVIKHPWPPASAWSQPGGVWGLAVARDGTVWTKNLLGLYYLRRGADTFEQAPGYAGGVIDFARDRNNRLWTADFATQRFYALPDLPVEGAVPQPEFGAAAPPTILGTVILDRDGTLWNANRVAGGLHRLSSVVAPGAPERFTLSQGLTSDLVTGVFEDREGNIWIGTARGIERFRYANIVIQPDLPVRLQATQLVATNDAVFLYSGMSAQVPEPSDAGQRLFRIRPGQAPELLASGIGQVEGMAPTPEGNLVFAAGGKLWTWSVTGIKEIPVPPELDGEHVVNLVVSDLGDVWVSFRGIGLYRLSKGQWMRVTPHSKTVDWVTIDHAGAAWLLRSGPSVLRIVGDEKTEIPFDVELGTIRATLADSEGMIVVADRGVAHFDGIAFKSLSRSRTRVFDLSFGIVKAPDGSLWIGTQTGIVRVKRDTFLKALANSEASLDFQLFDIDDGFTGLPPADVLNNSAVVGPDGLIWHLMNSGVATVDPGNLYRNPESPPVAITSVVEKGRVHDMPQRLEFPAGTSQLQINYTALSFVVPERVRFRYKLDGVDKDWVEAGARRQAFYTNLPPGEHRFQVIAANNDGVWNTTGATLAFSIAPTFLQSVWFQFLIVLLLVALAWVFYTLRLRQQAARLHNRFQVRMAERERIARELHDTLLQGVQGLLLRFQSISNRVPAGDLRASLEDALNRADAVLVEGRARVRDLRATGVEGDLAKMILRQAHEAIDGDTPRFVLTIEGSVRPLHQLATEEACRIAEEAIRNAITHAGAKTIEAVLSYRVSGLHLIVRDDGVGLPRSVLSTGERSGHYGLKGMRERAERVGGRLEISSRSDAGTEIVLTIPSRAAYSDRRSFFAWLRPARPTGDSK